MSQFPTGKCCVCGETTTTTCGACLHAGTNLFFCSRDHQKLVWKTHKAVCGARSNPFTLPPLSKDEMAIFERQTRDQLRGVDLEDWAIDCIQSTFQRTPDEYFKVSLSLQSENPTRLERYFRSYTRSRHVSAIGRRYTDLALIRQEYTLLTPFHLASWFRVNLADSVQLDYTPGFNVFEHAALVYCTLLLLDFEDTPPASYSRDLLPKAAEQFVRAIFDAARGGVARRDVEMVRTFVQDMSAMFYDLDINYKYDLRTGTVSDIRCTGGPRTFT
ncbi:hypothetical protein JCM10207_004858 [Rhodosporidiobolus poonsookiae]